MGVRCVKIESDAKRFDAAHVTEALKSIVAHFNAHAGRRQ
jgi:hypothetical protein